MEHGTAFFGETSIDLPRGIHTIVRARRVGGSHDQQVARTNNFHIHMKNAINRSSARPTKFSLCRPASPRCPLSRLSPLLFNMAANIRIAGGPPNL